MKTLFDQRRIGGRIARASALGLLALAAALIQSSEARAQWTTSGTNNTTTNNVGIGTTAPGSSLHISTGSGSGVVRGIINEQTSADSNSALFFFRKSRGGAAAQSGDNVGSLFASGFDGVNFVNSARLRFAIDGPVAAGSMPIGLQFMTGASGEGVERMRITSAGNVGVGTASPDSKLTVSNNAGSVPAGQPGTVAQFAGPNAGIARLLVDSYGDGNAATASIDMRRANNTAASPSALLAGNLIGQLTWHGFGATSYSSSRIAISGFAAENYTDTAQGSILTFQTTPLGATTRKEVMRMDSTGNVGIGTTAPAALLDGQRAETADLLMRLWNTSATGGTATLRIANSSNAGSRLQFSDSTAYVSTISAERTGGLRFRTGNASSEEALVDRMSITPGGNVGIGTAAPVSKLHVVGDVVVTGNISAKYQDVAEWVPSAQKLAAGMVVVLDTERDNHVLASHSAYDTRVAGVISAQPGLLLGEAGEGKVLVATTGRVKVKVDATRGPIKIGDLIVTSDVAGVAMKSEPVSVGGVAMHRPGTLIGKALESLEKGTGEILVLLSLQ